MEFLLVLNAGSSSLKFALFSLEAAPRRLRSGTIDRLGSAHATLTLKGENGEHLERKESASRDSVAGLDEVLACLAPITGPAGFLAVGHRIVHGGPHYRAPQKVDSAMLEELRRISSFDPEHLPTEIALLEAVTARFPQQTQIACFDTAFHSNMPRVAKLLPLPRRYEAQGVQRYGFHGISYAYLMRELERQGGPRAARGHVILAHLGNGASMAAVRDGQSIDTTMAFTPAAGLVMSTRSGDLDPGLVSFLAQSEQMTAAQFDRMANHESGLLGISETSSDMRDLLAREKEDPRASEAVTLFCYQARKWIGAYAAALGGLDTLIFSGGIGENAFPVRTRICEGLGWFGIELEPDRNAANAAVISTEASRVTVRVIRTDEELMIAREVSRLL